MGDRMIDDDHELVTGQESIPGQASFIRLLRMAILVSTQPASRSDVGSTLLSIYLGRKAQPSNS